MATYIVDILPPWRLVHQWTKTFGILGIGLFFKARPFVHPQIDPKFWMMLSVK